jgi:hypothetical protein
MKPAGAPLPNREGSRSLKALDDVMSLFASPGLKPFAGRGPLATLASGLFPAVDRLVAESHLVGIVSPIPFDVGVGELDVLTLVVCLPFH